MGAVVHTDETMKRLGNYDYEPTRVGQSYYDGPGNLWLVFGVSDQHPASLEAVYDCVDLYSLERIVISEAWLKSDETQGRRLT